MAYLEHYYTKFQSEEFYHIYNRGIDKKLIFKSSENYRFFLQKLKKYANGYFNIYSYCLLGNHFHLLIKINEFTDRKLAGKSTHDLVSHQLKKLFQSYSLAFNVQQNRTGGLFQTPFKRVKINGETHLKKIIHYIHLNPQKHAIINDFAKWKWSSFPTLISERGSFIAKNELLKIFSTKNQFIDFLRSESNETDILKVIESENY